MPAATLRTDDELLSSDDPEAFGLFYDRHVKSLLGYFARRTHDPEVAADLTAETFAAALVARRRFKARRRAGRGVAVRDRGAAAGRLPAPWSGRAAPAPRAGHRTASAQ